jgi:O-antigen/teichoic acid export membrane protein
MMTENQDAESKKQILKSTGIVGGAQVASILIRIVRTKIIALLLGPLGVGIAGLYSSTLDIVRSATGLGLDFSAVRDIAEANSTGDERRISRTITIMRRWMWITGLAGVALLVIFRNQFSLIAFKDEAHSLDFLMLAAIPLLSAISGGQLALLRGIRKIGDMARANVLGAISGFCITVPLYWVWGVKGIVPAMLLSAMADLGLSWSFARKLKILSTKISVRDTFKGGSGMIRLGFFTVLSSLAVDGVMYLVRIIIVNRVGLEGVGQFQAAWNIAATYMGLVLYAIGMDYYPRLVSVNQDDALIRKLVNEQTEVALLLAGPLVVGMLGFADIVIRIFYSNKFGQSSDIFLWQLMGELLQVISWPMIFVILAKGKGLLYVLSQLSWNIIMIVGVWLFIGRIGITISGIAFFVGHAVYVFISFILCNRTCGFRWSAKSIKSILAFGCLVTLAFFNIKYQPTPLWRGISFLLLAGAVTYSYFELRKIVDIRSVLDKWFRKK